MESLKRKPGVFHAADVAVVKVTRDDLVAVRESSQTNLLRRARLCVHRSGDAKIHEMLISIAAKSYIRPHRHPGKTESFHLVEGTLDVVLFTADGVIADVIHMGDYQSGRVFYYRLSEPLFHTVVVRSELAIVHETTNGPFVPSDTEFASWAPDESDAAAAARFMLSLELKTNVSD